MRLGYTNTLFQEGCGIFLIAILPLLIYLKKMDYSLRTPEVLIIASVILAISLLLRLVLIPGKTPAYVAALTVVSVLVVDIQTDWITTLGLRLLLSTIFFCALFWFTRKHLHSLVTIVVGAMVLVTAVLPGEKSAGSIGEPAVRVSDRADLPFVLHLILDEHIGIEGIPAEFDPQRDIAASIRDFYLERSFTVYGRAYSQYSRTRDSISNFMNFDSAANLDAYLDKNHERGMLLANNGWFDLLHDQGYRIHVLESDYLKFFDPETTKNNPSLDTRDSYNTLSIKPIQYAQISAWQKIPFILSIYLKLSWILQPLITDYPELAFSELGQKMHLPQWDLQGHYPVNLASYQALDAFTKQLSHAGPGQAFFAHIQLPHYPYGLDRDCQMELQPSYWYECYNRDVLPQYNTVESRALRYPRYLDQIVCLMSRLDEMFQVLMDKGLWDDAIVIIHGDHGSRISIWPPNTTTKEKMVPADYMDFFSTLFVIKAPGVAAGYNSRMLPIDHLFTRVMRDGIAPGDSLLEAKPSIYLENGKKSLVKQAMPNFAAGKPSPN